MEVTDALLDGLGLSLNRTKSIVASFDQGFKFLGALFLHDEVYLPFAHPQGEGQHLALPPPLDLWAYLELKHAGARP